MHATPSPLGRVLWIRMLVVLALLLMVAAYPAAATPGAPRSASDIVSGEILVGWQPGSSVTPPDFALGRTAEEPHSAAWQATVSVLASRTGLTVLDAHPAYGFARLAVPAGREEQEIARLAAMPWVTYAEPNYRVQALGTPNDPYFPQQWNMTRVNAPQAWDMTMGDPDLIVAVIDSGLDLTHPEFTGVQGRVLSGVNYITPGTLPQDDYGHGTHVTGILAAATDNGLGVAGMASNVKILPLKVLDHSGGGTVADVATALYTAVAQGAKVINLSLGLTNPSGEDSTTLHTAVIDAHQQGALLVAAAGNNGSTDPFYPAAYSEVIAVGGSDVNDNIAYYSNHAPGVVALAAPGGSIYNQSVISTWPLKIGDTTSSGYRTDTGTSMASPMVAGAAALVWSVYPELSADEVAYILKNTADQVGPYAYTNGRNDYFGYGRLNAARAVRGVTISSRDIGIMVGSNVPQSSASTLVKSAATSPIGWQTSVVSGTTWLSITPWSGFVARSLPATLKIRATQTGLTPGSYEGVVQFSTMTTPPVTININVHLRVVNTVYQTWLPMAAR